MTTKHLSAILAIAFACLMAGAAHASGGVYLDDLTVTNYSTPMFTDHFNDPTLRGWSNLHDVSLGQMGEGSYLLYMNAHSDQAATAWRQLNMKDAGVVEVSFKMLVTPPDEQYKYKKDTFSLFYLVLASGNTPATAKAIVSLKQHEKGNRVSIAVQQTTTPATPQAKPEPGKPMLPTLGLQNATLKNLGAMSPGLVIQPKTWVLVTLKLDSKKSMASVLVDNKEIVSKPYKPQDFQSVRGIWLWSTYGDGAKPKK